MKKIIACCLACLTLVSFCGCSFLKKQSYIDITEEIINDENIVFYAKQDVYPNDIRLIKCYLCYEGEERGIIVTSEGYHKATLHKLVDGVWKELEYREDYVYLYMNVSPGFYESGIPTEFRVSTDCFITPLEEGTYRVATRVFIPQDDTYFENGDFVYYGCSEKGQLCVSEPFTIE